MTRLLTKPRPIAGWVRGVIQDAPPDSPMGTVVSAENFVPTPAGRLATRGGSRVMLTLHESVSAAVLDHVLTIGPLTGIGFVVIGWSSVSNDHYAYRITQDGAFFTGTEATSRHQMPTSPTTDWSVAPVGTPVMSELFEKLYIADATLTYTDRKPLTSMDNGGSFVVPTFAFGAGAAAKVHPYCLEQYNGHLFIAGYGTEDANDGDRPEYIRHSFLGRAPDDTTAGAEGFHKDAWLELGAIGQRVTALRSGKGILLAAKDHEFYRITGFGRAYPGWQFQVDQVENTTGLGISNPNALTYAEGYWYGLGPQGPLRTDGFTVESLRGPRQRDWLGLNHLDTSWVTYHPERRLILFGVHPAESASGKSTTYPWRIWAWDVDRSVWAPDWNPGANLFIAQAVQTTTAPGPSAPPNTLAVGSLTTTGYTATWVNGDATCLTEYWEQLGDDGTWALVDTLSAAAVTKVRTGLTGHQKYNVKIRHKKGSVFSGYTAVVPAYTVIPAPTKLERGPTPYGGIASTVFAVTVGVGGPGMVLVVERALHGSGVWVASTETIAANLQTPVAGRYLINAYFAPFGLVTPSGPSPQADVRVSHRDPAWTIAGITGAALTNNYPSLVVP